MTDRESVSTFVPDFDAPVGGVSLNREEAMSFLECLALGHFYSTPDYRLLADRMLPVAYATYPGPPSDHRFEMPATYAGIPVTLTNRVAGGEDFSHAV